MSKRRSREFGESESYGKRRRNASEEVPMSQEERLVSLISKLGGQTAQLESNMQKLADVLSDEYPIFREIILKAICRAVADHPEKVSVYSTLVGLLNAKQSKIGEEVLDELLVQLKESLSANQFERVRFFVRFLADLVNTRVLEVESIVEVFDALLAVKFELSIPQTRSDWFIYCVMSALPWVAHELHSKNKENLDRIIVAVEEYVSKRDKGYVAALTVFMAEDSSRERDYLDNLLIQVKAMGDKKWKEDVTLRPYVQFSRYLSEGRPHKFPELSIPRHSEDCVYPLPWIPMRIFTEEDEAGSIPPSASIERYLMEDLISNICLTYCASRKDTVVTLVQQMDRVQQFSMPHVTVEVLVGHILQLPCAPNIPVFYGAVLNGLCKQKPTVIPVIPAQLNRVVHKLFREVTSMNPVCINRFAQWFAHHLSNWKFEWEWDKWSSVLQLPAQDHPKVRFIKEVLAKCLRLSYYDQVEEIVPVSFRPLLPLQPEESFKFEPKAGAAVPGATVAVKLLDAISSRKTPAELILVLDELKQHYPDASLEDLQNGKVELTTQCLLAHGKKSITHCFTALFKYRPLLLELVQTDGAKVVCVKAVAEYFQLKPLWLQLVLNKLIRMQVIDPGSVVSFVFLPEAVDVLTRHFIWDILDVVIQTAVTMYSKTSADLKEQRAELAKYSELEGLAVYQEDMKEGLEGEVAQLEGKLVQTEETVKGVFLLLCQKFVSTLTQHLSVCEERSQNPNNQWFLCALNGFQHIMLQYRPYLMKYMAELELQVFTKEMHPMIATVHQRLLSLMY